MRVVGIGAAALVAGLCISAPPKDRGAKEGDVPAGEKKDAPPRLDLPAGRKIADDEEPGPEAFAPTIKFYGHVYQANAFFFCLDCSGSMGERARSGTKLDVLKGELAPAIESLPRHVEFGLLFFSEQMRSFTTSPVRATPENKERAVAWLSTIAPEGVTCMARAGQGILEIAWRSTRPRKCVILVSDGLPNCECPAVCALEAITGANHERIPIHTLFIAGGELEDQGAGFMRRLAQHNDGTYHIVN